jgi:hypothetical protein
MDGDEHVVLYEPARRLGQRRSGCPRTPLVLLDGGCQKTWSCTCPCSETLSPLDVQDDGGALAGEGEVLMLSPGATLMKVPARCPGVEGLTSR